MSRLSEKYNKEIIAEFLKSGYSTTLPSGARKFVPNYKNKLAVPKVTKVVVSSGIGKIRENEKLKKMIKSNLSAITGQMPAVRKAKKAISGFKVREGEEVGYITTLRGIKMYDFLDKLANTVLPRVRDFRGLDPKSFDQAGNFNLGIREHIVFSEIAAHADNIHSLEVTIVTSAKKQKEAQKLLEMLGFPFKKEK